MISDKKLDKTSNITFNMTLNNDIQHVLQLDIQHEKYEEKKANTDRLKDFALIYMQNLLNKHEDQKINQLIENYLMNSCVRFVVLSQ